MVRRSAPGPSIVKSLLMSMTPLVSVIVCAALKSEEKTIVSPEFATSTASRKLQSTLHTPSFVSEVLVTVQVAACAPEAPNISKTPRHEILNIRDKRRIKLSSKQVDQVPV